MGFFEFFGLLVFWDVKYFGVFVFIVFWGRIVVGFGELISLINLGLVGVFKVIRVGRFCLFVVLVVFEGL